KGRIELKTGEQGLSGKVAGLLKLNINEIKIPLIELALKGFSIEGLLKNVVIEGDGTLEISPEKITLDKSSSSDKPAELKINGSFDSLVFRDDPSMRKSEVKGLANGKVIKSEMKIENAKVEVKDLESFEFIRPDPDAGRKADLKKLKVNQISITDIQAS